MVGEDILLEIDHTLDRLIRNAEAIEHVDLKDLTEVEIDYFQKTQESLLQHLIHMDEFFVEKKNSLKVPDKRCARFKIQEKLLRFEKMKEAYHPNLTKAIGKLQVLSKRKFKRFLNIQ